MSEHETLADTVLLLMAERVQLLADPNADPAAIEALSDRIARAQRRLDELEQEEQP